jgi:DNA repair protein SbcD/Mre11
MRSIRFIHTADIHLDTSLSSVGFPSRLGSRKREAIRGTFRHILEEARSQNVDFVLIAGDLFEHERVTPDTVEFLKQQFASLSPIPIFITPGNHDPYIHGSPYLEEAWPGNVTLFTDEAFRFVELPDIGIRVAGFGFNRTHLDRHVFLELPVLEAGLSNIVIAHGSDIDRIPTGKSQHGPFVIDEIAGKNVQYCALGHYHQQHQVINPIDLTQCWYSGIPEGRGWDEEGKCGYIVGEIAEDGVHVETYACNQYPLQTIEIDCGGFSSREQVFDAILQHKQSLFDSSTILRIRLCGTADPKLELLLPEMEERLAGEAFHITWEDQTEPEIDFEAMAKERTLRGRVVRTLNSRIAAASEEEKIPLERARLYGVQALLGREVRLR